jgi:hypothetical protein
MVHQEKTVERAAALVRAMRGNLWWSFSAQIFFQQQLSLFSSFLDS